MTDHHPSEQHHSEQHTNATQPGFEFETALTQLEQLVQRMESGELSLQDSLQAFEQGVQLTRQCQQALSSAEQRVQILMKQNGQSVPYPFQEGEQ